MSLNDLAGDLIPSNVNPPIDRISEQTPIVKEKVPLLELYNDEIPGTTDVSENGRLYTKYLRYTNLVADITEAYDQYMIRNVETLIRKDFVVIGKSPPNVPEADSYNFVLGFENVMNITKSDKTPLWYRQNGQTYCTEMRITGVLMKEYTNPAGRPREYVNDEKGTRIQYEFTFGEYPTMVGSSVCITKIKNMGPRERFAAGECPDDPPGYQIIEGKEYFLPLQEKIRTNYPYTIYDDKYHIKMTCDNMIDSTSSVSIFKDIDNVYKININSLSPEKQYGGRDINILQLFRFFGLNNDNIMNLLLIFTKKIWRNELHQEIMTSFYNLKLIPNDLEHFVDLSGKFKEFASDKNTQINKYRDMIEAELLTTYTYNRNDPSHKADVLGKKIQTLALMLVKLMETVLGFREIDKRDSWYVKRVVSVGPKMYQIFSSKWKEFITKIENNKKKGTTTPKIESIINSAKDKLDLKGFYESCFKNAWGTNKNNKKKKQTDVLSRQSKLAPFAAMKRMSISGSKENKMLQPREPQMGQFGFISVPDTPDGKEQCGLTKNAAVTAWISIGHNEILLMRILSDLYNMKKIFPRSTTKENATILFVNGKLIGQCLGDEVATALRMKRRSRQLPKDTSIVFDKNDNMLYVYTDNGRLCRPLLIVNEQTYNLVIDEKNMWDAQIEELLSAGCIEMIDTYEQEFTYISPNIDNVRNRNVMLEQIKKSIKEIEDSLKLYKENNIVNYAPLQEELRKKRERRDDIIKKIESLKNLIEFHKNKAQSIKSQINETDTVEERRLKFINDDYYIKRENRTINDLQKRLDAEEKRLTKYDDSIEIKVTSDYFENLLDITINRYKTLSQRKSYTHCEIHNSAIMSISESVIPLANRNPTTRVGFQCGMGRQALGIYHSNERFRFDTTAKMLVTPTAPIITGQNNEIIGTNKYGQGVNMIIAILPFRGQTPEDSIILNKAYVERGGGRSKVTKSISHTIKKFETRSSGENVISEMTKTPPPRTDKDISVYRHLGIEGIARPESVIRTGDCLIGIKNTIKSSGKVEVKDSSVYATSEYNGYVIDRYNVTTIGSTVIRIVLRDYRFPRIGDKFSSRIAQKTTVSTLMDPEDIPFAEDGTQPDAMVSPAAFTSRMAGSYIIEMLLGKAALMESRRVLGGAFDKDIDITQFEEILRTRGFNPKGYDTLYSGITGKPFTAKIYTGIVHYQLLKHQVKDKKQARQRGTRDQLTNQPIKGRKKGGGIKFGEMERDTLVAHGVPALLRDVSCISSDNYKCIICKKCRNVFSVNFSLTNRMFRCQICEKSDHIVKIDIPFASVALAGVVSTSHIQFPFILKKKNE